MNPFKKLKLKSQLRNCDYVLAGTVIKQQYYDSAKSTVINRLIDEFMADPNFDNALKLIEYNEMLTFYFTESCAGGLYVRKSSQDAPDDADAAHHVSVDADDGYGEDETGFVSGSRTDNEGDGWADSWIGTSSETRLEPDTGTAQEKAWDVQAAHETAESPDDDGVATEEASMPTDEDMKRKYRQQKQQQILRESEALMEQLLSLDMRRRKPAQPQEETASPDDAEWSASGTGGGEEVGDTDMATRQYDIGDLGQEEAAPAAEPMPYQDPEHMETATYKDGFGMPDADASESYIAESSTGNEHGSAAWSFEAETTKEAEAVQPESSPIQDESQHHRDTYAAMAASGGSFGGVPDKDAPEAPVHRLPKRSYANVIATLKIDIHTMATQLEDYRRELSYNPANEQQLIEWINALEDAIEEFSQVVDHLEEQH